MIAGIAVVRVPPIMAKNSTGVQDEALLVIDFVGQGPEEPSGRRAAVSNTLVTAPTCEPRPGRPDWLIAFRARRPEFCEEIREEAEEDRMWYRCAQCDDESMLTLVALKGESEHR